MVVWTYDKQQQLEKLQAEGRSIEWIAFHFHLSPYTILSLLHIMPAQPYEPYNPTLSEFDTKPFRAKDYWDENGHILDEEYQDLENLWEEMKF